MKENSNHRLTIDCIYEALIQLMKNRPFREISITDITRKAGVSRMAYYRNYSDKKEILLHHLQEQMDQMEARILTRQDLSKTDLWMDLLEILQKDPIMHYLMEAGIVEESFQSHLNYLTRIYARLYGLDPEDTDTNIFIHRQLGSIFGCFLYMAHNKGVCSQEQIARHLISIVESGILPASQEPVIQV